MKSEAIQEVLDAYISNDVTREQARQLLTVLFDEEPTIEVSVEFDAFPKTSEFIDDLLAYQDIDEVVKNYVEEEAAYGDIDYIIL